MKIRKPIICQAGTHSFNYRYSHIGYVAGVEIWFDSDLSWKEFERLLDGGYSGRQIERFEVRGSFQGLGIRD